ncbi:MAG: glycoside hydrolase family 88 protein [Bacteroidota bacterium]
MAAGMTELLRALPKDNPDRSRIMQGYKTMMASLLKYQSENGMWRQLVDDTASWAETSCTVCSLLR